MGKNFNQWLNEFVDNGANPKDVTNWPEEAGDGGEFTPEMVNYLEDRGTNYLDLLKLVDFLTFKGADLDKPVEYYTADGYDEHIHGFILFIQDGKIERPSLRIGYNEYFNGVYIYSVGQEGFVLCVPHGRMTLRDVLTYPENVQYANRHLNNTYGIRKLWNPTRIFFDEEQISFAPYEILSIFGNAEFPLYDVLEVNSLIQNKHFNVDKLIEILPGGLLNVETTGVYLPFYGIKQGVYPQENKEKSLLYLLRGQDCYVLGVNIGILWRFRDSKTLIEILNENRTLIENTINAIVFNPEDFDEVSFAFGADYSTDITNCDYYLTKEEFSYTLEEFKEMPENEPIE